MKTKIPDVKIKKYLNRYNSGDMQSYSVIVNLLSPYIYNYPRIVFSSDSDRCSEFYEYILIRLKKILTVYKESEAKFITWFTVVLRNRYLNYIREQKAKNSPGENFIHVSLDAGFEDSRSLYNIIGEHRDFMYQEQEWYNVMIERIVSGLREKQRIFFHLYYIETLRPEDIGFISITLDMAVRDILTGLDEVRNSMLRKYELKNTGLSKLNIVFQKILKKQKEGRAKEVESLKEKRMKLLEEYRRIKLNPSYESLVLFLHLPLGTISTGISRMKSAVKDILKEFYHEKLPVS